MKLFLVTLLVAYASADVSHVVNDERNAQILRQEQDIGLEGEFQWSYETQNGISARAQGGLKNANSDSPAQVVQGEVTYTAPGGEVVQTQYSADENGYIAVGSHIPTSPPIPEAILRSLEYIAAHPPREVIEERAGPVIVK